MSVLTERAASLLTFLEDHADHDGMVRGVNYTDAPYLWSVWDTTAGSRSLAQAVDSNVDDFPEVVAELVLKGRVEVVEQDFHLTKGQ